MAATLREQEAEIGVRAPVETVIGLCPNPRVILRMNKTVGTGMF